MNIVEFIKKVPKTELHLHIEGTIEPDHMFKLAKKNNIKVVVDNILVSPVLQNPSKFGADIIVYSGTKHIDGQGRTMGGAILSSEKFREEILKPFLYCLNSLLLLGKAFETQLGGA